METTAFGSGAALVLAGAAVADAIVASDGFVETESAGRDEPAPDAPGVAALVLPDAPLVDPNVPTGAPSGVCTAWRSNGGKASTSTIQTALSAAMPSAPLTSHARHGVRRLGGVRRAVRRYRTSPRGDVRAVGGAAVVGAEVLDVDGTDCASAGLSDSS